LPDSFYRLYADNYKSLTMKTEVCFEIFHCKLSEYDFCSLLKEKIMKKTQVYNLDEFDSNLSRENWTTKMDYMILLKFYNDSFVFIKEVEFQFRKLRNKTMDVEPFYEAFLSAIKEFKYSKEDVDNLFFKYFHLENEKISLESFFNFYDKFKYTYKIRTNTFLKIFLDKLDQIYGLLEKEIKAYYDMADIKQVGMIFMKEFEFMMNHLLNGNENIWKIGDYFK